MNKAFYTISVVMIITISLASCQDMVTDNWRSQVKKLTVGEKKECPTTNIEQNFKTEKFLGRWYEMYRSQQLPFQIGDCNFASYSLLPNGNVRIINSQRFFDMPGFGKGKMKNDKVIGETAGAFTTGTVVKPPITPTNQRTEPAYSMKMDGQTEKQSRIRGVPEFKRKSFYQEQFGNLNVKFKDQQGRMLTYRQAEGVARKRVPSDNDGRFQLKFNKFQPVWGNYDVLDTDYENYAIIYSCRTLLWGRIKN